MADAGPAGGAKGSGSAGKSKEKRKKRRSGKGKAKKGKGRTLTQAEVLAKRRQELRQSETLRWENALPDRAAEAERLRRYKEQRRTRYAAHRAKLLGVAGPQPTPQPPQPLQPRPA